MPQPYRLFIVTIDPNGGKVNGHDKAYCISMMENSRFTLPEAEEAPEGYELVGWYVGDIGTDDPAWADPEEDDPHIAGPNGTFICNECVDLCVDCIRSIT